MLNAEKRNKHLTYDDRLNIQEGLTQGLTFKAIAASIGKDQTTISKEVKKHLSLEQSKTRHFNLDGQPIEIPVCPSLLTAPFVCNGCKKRRVRCSFEKRLYYAKRAQKEYETTLSETREGIPLSRESFYEMNRIVSNGIKLGQHLYHISKTHDLGVSKSTIYRHLHRGYLSVSPIDFPRVVKFKRRDKKPALYVPKAAKIGRSHEDFLNHVAARGITSWVELDTVIGRIGGKVIMTIHFTFCNFMAGLLLPDKTAASLSQAVIALKKRLSDSGVCFGSIVPLALTDNGGEFSDIFAIENDSDGRKETDLFFCDPMSSSQKPYIEKNHTLFRDIAPKGSSFDNYSQGTVNLIFSHVNSVKRHSLNGKTPYDLFAFTYGHKAASLFGITPIAPERVIQSPALLKA